jgi:hypothetical protein
MIEETDLLNVCIQVAQEFWTLGEAFVYAELDETNGKWGRLVIQNPDYINVQRSTISGEPIISLRPDENLKRIVNGNKPSDIQQRQQLDRNIIEHVRRNENIPLSNFYVSHIPRKIAPYEIRGTGLPVSVFRQLMLFDKIRECYSEDTEVLTNIGYKKINELLEFCQFKEGDRYQVGTWKDDSGNLHGVKLRDDILVACMNPKNNNIEYHKPTNFHISDYEGNMMHFIGKKVDILVTPEHDMWAEKCDIKNSKYEKIKAKDMLKTKKFWKFQTMANHIGNDPEFIEVCEKQIPIDLYLKVLGYIVSEGCIYSNYKNGRYDAFIRVTQLTSSDVYEDMRSSFEEFAKILDKNNNSYISLSGYGFSEHCPKEKWTATINGKRVCEHFINSVGTDVNTKSLYKKLPRWVFDLSSSRMEILLNALVKGDGNESLSKYNGKSKNFYYSTVSEQLANDVYELVYKTGKAPNLGVYEAVKSHGKLVKEFRVLWSTTNYGKNPTVCSFEKVDRNNGGGAVIKQIPYSGKVWCFEVPTGLFITRRNYKTTIQGNCKFAQADSMINPLTLIKVGGGSDNFRPGPEDLNLLKNTFEEAYADKNFKIFTHDAVTVEPIGFGSGIYDTSGDITQLIKEIYIGLMVPSVVMDGGGDITYENGGVSLDVLRQRYMSFRNMLSSWLRRKIFAPISKIHDFYEVKDGKKMLIVPEIEWNHMSMFDVGTYVGNLNTLLGAEPRKVSLHTVYKSLGLEYEEEMRRIRQENIDIVLQKRELETLDTLNLSELKTLTDISELKERKQKPIPGEQEALPGEEGEMPGMDLGMPSGDIGLPGQAPPEPQL